MHTQDVMRQKNRNHKRAGHAMLESAMMLSVILSVLIGAFDFGQILFTRQMLVERVRIALRWGIVNAYDETKVKNMVRYGQSTTPNGTPVSYLGLTSAQVSVVKTNGTTADPNDLRLTISIIDYQYKLFTPKIAKTFTDNYAVVESSPIVYRP